MTTEKDIQTEILNKVNSSGLAILFRINVGRGFTPDGRPISFGGVKGMPDLIGWGGYGRFVAVECKAKTRLRPEQKKFKDNCELWGCLWIKGTSADQVMKELESAFAGYVMSGAWRERMNQIKGMAPEAKLPPFLKVKL